MKSMTAEAIINIAMLLGVSAAIIIGLIITGRVSVMWFFLIPAFVMVGTSRSSDKSKEVGNEQDRD